MINLLIPAVSGLLDKFIEDKDEKAKLAHEIATMAENQAHESVMAQIKVNEVQAAHKSLFVAGGRPAIMWICAFGLGWQFVFQPVAVWGLALSGTGVALPIIETEGLMSLTLALLGLGGMRSFEKSKGVQRNNMNRR